MTKYGFLDGLTQLKTENLLGKLCVALYFVALVLLRGRMALENQWFQGLVDLEVYPILDLENRKIKEVISRAKCQLDQLGAAEMTGFLTPHGVKKLTEESVQMEQSAYWNALTGNAYLDEPEASLPENHIRRWTESTSLGAVGYDQFPEHFLLRRIYEWEPFMNFIREVLSLPKLYRYADPMGALNLSVMKKGDYLRWHFDQSDFVTSLAVRNSEVGGEFEYAPRIRAPKNENYEDVGKLLKGDRTKVVTIPNHPGTLLVFQGRYSIHRVTEIQGETSRLIGLFGYADEPGVMSSDYLRKIRYGRTSPLKQGI